MRRPEARIDADLIAEYATRVRQARGLGPADSFVIQFAFLGPEMLDILGLPPDFQR